MANFPKKGLEFLAVTWGKPLTGDEVGIYEIHRRERPAGAWGLTKNSHETEITVTNQTRGIEYEYRVIANNKAGDGPPSNAVMAVL